jgi:ubiquinone/menaquinone biosynthesis C-methylase UbiE
MSIIESQDIVDIETHEKEHWDSYYASALNENNYSMQHKKWWGVADDDLREIVLSYLSSKERKFLVLESGCGSASSSYRLSKYLKELHLLDISEGSLNYAKNTIPGALKKCTTFHNGSVFSSPFDDNYFDLTWNCGVVEHYDSDLIILMANEMVRVTKQGGFVMIGIPNIYSLEMIKTRILSSKLVSKLLSWIPGYRLDSEILYSNRTMKNILKKVKGVDCVKVEFAGNLLIEDSPNWLIDITQKLFHRSRLSFLTVFVLKKTYDTNRK